MKKIILTLTISLSIIAALVICKNLFSCRIPIGNRGIGNAIDSGDLDVLFIGSSTFRSNLDIKTLDETFGGRDYILAYGGNQLAAIPIQYDEIVRRSGNKYSLMVFELDPLMLTEEVKLSDSRVIFDLSWQGKRELWNKLKQSEDTDFPVFYEYFITSGFDDIITYPLTEPFYSTRYYKGAKNEDTPSSGREFLESEEFDISGYVINPLQEEAVYDIIRKCSDNGQDFIFLESPHYYRLADDPVYKKYLEYFTGILDEEGVSYILAEDVNFDNKNPDLFEDMGHMSGKGRSEYTKELTPLLSFHLQKH